MFEQVEKKMCEEEIVQRSRENDFRSFAEPKVAKAIWKLSKLFETCFEDKSPAFQFSQNCFHRIERRELTENHLKIYRPRLGFSFQAIA